MTDPNSQNSAGGLNEEILYHREGATGVITFNRPQARNALTFEMYEAVATICNNIIEKRKIYAR